MMLALRMGRTLAELQASMSSQEFSLWMEAYEEDQFGEARHDFRAGVIAAAVGNFAGKVLKSSEPLEPGSFFPRLAVANEAPEPDPVTFFTAVSKTQKFDKKR